MGAAGRERFFVILLPCLRRETSPRAGAGSGQRRKQEAVAAMGKVSLASRRLRALQVPARPSALRGLPCSAPRPALPAGRAAETEQPSSFQLCVSADGKNINMEWAGGTNNS